MRPTVLILHAPGTNRDREAAWAIEKAGGDPEIVHLGALVETPSRLADYRMLVLPGGFSFGDDLGAGRLWAVALQSGLREALDAFVEAGRPVLGICNGFQALVKAGLLPGDAPDDPVQRVTLHHNDDGRFVCRWVWLRAEPDSPCVFLRGQGEALIHCPVAHGEGRLLSRDDLVRASIGDHRLAALRYVQADGSPAEGSNNPNGSEGDIAGLCNPAGNVLGLMPHPEDHIVPWQNPQHHRRPALSQLGLPLFEAGVRYASEV